MGQKVSRLGDVFGSRNGDSSRNGGGGGAAAGCASGGGSCCCAAAMADRQRRPSEDVGAADAAGARLPDAVVITELCEASTSGADAIVAADCSQSSSKGPKRSHWKLRFNARSKSAKNRVPPSLPESPPPPQPPPTLEILPDEPCVSEVDSEPCIRSVYRRTEDDLHSDDIGVNFDEVIEAEPLEGEEREEETESVVEWRQHDLAQFERAFQSFEHHSQLVLPSFDEGMMDLHSDFIGEQFMMDDAEDRAYKERAKEIQEGIEPPPGFRPGVHIQLLEFNLPKMNFNNLTTLFHRAAITALNAPQDLNDRVHTSIDYIHYLVPDLLQITNCSCYWGKMDRYEAEKLLDNKPEGTFLLRDSAQDEYLFSVSFRKYGRSLHARIEQWNHLFSFDSRDPGVFASTTVCGLVEHYKDPTCCMFFEPMLTLPLHRNFTFTLQHACRATICSMIGYDDVNQLKLPKCLKSYLKEYHYKQRVRVRVFDDNLTEMQSINYA